VQCHCRTHAGEFQRDVEYRHDDDAAADTQQSRHQASGSGGTHEA